VHLHLIIIHVCIFVRFKSQSLKRNNTYYRISYNMKFKLLHLSHFSKFSLSCCQKIETYSQKKYNKGTRKNKFIDKCFGVKSFIGSGSLYRPEHTRLSGSPTIWCTILQKCPQKERVVNLSDKQAVKNEDVFLSLVFVWFYSGISIICRVECCIEVNGNLSWSAEVNRNWIRLYSLLHLSSMQSNAE